MTVYLSMTIIGALGFVFSAFADGKDYLGRTTIKRPIVKRTVANCISVCSFLVVFIIFGFRYHLGAEYFNNYLFAYNQLKMGMNTDVHYGIATGILMRLLAAINAPEQSFFVITSVVLLIPLWYAIYKLSPIPWLSWVIFVISRAFFISMADIETGIAAVLLFIAVKYIKEQQIYKYLVCVMLAILFHWVAIFFIPVYWLANIKINIAGWLATAALISIISNKIGMMIASVYDKNGSGTNVFYSNRFDNTFFMIFLVVLIAIYYISSDARLGENKDFRLTFYICFIALILSVNLNVLPYGLNIYWLYFVHVVFFVPEMICRIDNKTEKAAVLLVLLVLFGYITYKDCAVSKVLHCFPYRSFLLKDLVFN